MRDMFDEFMDELRRRQAELEGKAKGEPAAGHEGQTNERSGGDPDAEPQEETVDGSHEADDQDERDDQPEIRRVPFGGGRGAGGRGPGGPRRGGPSDEFPELRLSRGWVILGGVFIALFALATLFSLSVGLVTDGMWFNSVGFGGVFWTRIVAQVGSFAVGAVVAFVFLWFNLWFAGRVIPKSQLRRFSLDDLLDRFSIERYAGNQFNGPFNRPAARPAHPREDITVPNIGRPAFWILVGVGLLLALGLGALLSSNWTTLQLFLHRTPFGQTDPSFNLDISFYLFELPLYRLAQSYANTLLLFALVLTGIRYIVAVVSGASMPTAARVQLGLLAMLYLWSIGIGYQLDRYELVYSNASDKFQGFSATDAAARVLAVNVMTGIVLFIGAMVAYLAYARSATPLMLVLSLWVGAYFVLEVGYPFAIGRFVVAPNQQVQEAPYIKANIDMTRLAYGINGWTSSSYTPSSTITQQAVAAEPGTIQNVRLWDTVPLGKTLGQVQIIRSYYTFTSVTTDRYTFTDPASCSPNPAPCVRQVMLAGRELDPTKLDASWVNQHITYTHGTGLAMAPVNDTGQQGQPNLLIQDLPPTSDAGTPTVSQPRIYFGLQESNYVIVGASSSEFDYPSDKGDQNYNWTGTSGIKLDNTLVRLLYAAKFGDLNLLISAQLTNNSQLLYNRSITDRIQAIAPYLRVDNDPYLVVTPDGGLYYMVDAYTTSTQFPDAQPLNPGGDANATGLAGDSFNYVRNSVKIAMNAYDGTMSFYVSDPSDPIIKAWQGVFPDMYKPLSAMPAGLQAHIRYPQDYFDAQTSVFAKYHITDPGVFYQGVQFWQVPEAASIANAASGKAPEQLPLESFYLQMRVPGKDSDGFMLLQPMVPKNRTNMIAWVAVSNDYPTNYGQVSVFDFPENSNVFGPVQMQSLVQQNKDISQQITLWEGAGSHVVLGNLLVIPLQNTLMYVEPVYLQSQNGPLPVFQKVVVGTPTQVVWGNSLSDALNQIYAGQGTIQPGNGGTPPPGASPTPGGSASAGTGTPSPTATTTPGPLPSLDVNATPQQLIAAASAHYQAAQDALKAGDLGTYQREMNTVGQILAQLEKVLGTPVPSAALPAPSPSN